MRYGGFIRITATTVMSRCSEYTHACEVDTISPKHATAIVVNLIMIFSFNGVPTAGLAYRTAQIVTMMRMATSIACRLRRSERHAPAVSGPWLACAGVR